MTENLNRAPTKPTNESFQTNKRTAFEKLRRLPPSVRITILAISIPGLIALGPKTASADTRQFFDNQSTPSGIIPSSETCDRPIASATPESAKRFGELTKIRAETEYKDPKPKIELLDKMGNGGVILPNEITMLGYNSVTGMFQFQINTPNIPEVIKKTGKWFIEENGFSKQDYYDSPVVEFSINRRVLNGGCITYDKVPMRPKTEE